MSTTAENPASAGQERTWTIAEDWVGRIMWSLVAAAMLFDIGAVAAPGLQILRKLA
jgi:hypothetical protein